MKKKNNLFKNIFLVFFACCFFSVGLATLNLQKEDYASAADSSNTYTNETLPDYFAADEYLDDGDESTTNTINTSATEDTFLYFSEGGVSNYYQLSLKTNKNDSNVSSDIYKWVYYPDVDNKSVFHFYNINSVSLYINGVDQKITKGNFIDGNNLSFPAKDNITLESFDMIFSNSASPAENEISILENGKVKEGLYQLSLNYTLFTCTDGGDSMAETEFLPDTIYTINYQFYVLDKDSYIQAETPNISWDNFDHKTSVSTKFPEYSAFLYSNYSNDQDAKSEAYAMPYVEYDYTRFELEISNGSDSTIVEYDLAQNSPKLNGDNLIDTISIDESTNKAKIYFVNTDQYDISFKPIKIIDFATSATESEPRKLSLVNLANETKKSRVYVFGYQAKYTDFDGELTENGTYPSVELKTPDAKEGKFKKGADITSGFLNSSSTYSQESGNTSFLISNIAKYIEDEKIPVVKTNQKPIDMDTNATIGSNSYIYSTTQVSSAYKEYGTLNGEKLYRTKFTGLTDSTAGKYIYIISYTYDNYYENENTLDKTKLFYQVFYFEILEELPTIQIQTEDSKNIPTGSFTNQKVTIIDTNANEDNIYNKDVRVQIYVQDYDENFLAEYGGRNGINYSDWTTQHGAFFEENGIYTVRLFYESEIKNNSAKLDYDYSFKGEKAYFKQRTFKIDREEISNIAARNVTPILNTTNYNIRLAANGDTMFLDSFVTNQDIIISWDEKNSGAQTYACYRYFPIVDAEYYGTDADSISKVLSYMLYGESDSYLPVDSLLDLSTDNNQWDRYQGNTKTMTQIVSTEYVFSKAGVYLLEVYDEAGNHNVEVFMIDNTTPVFAIETLKTGNFEIASPSMYITEESKLYWAKNKAFYISDKAGAISYTNIANANSITLENLKNTNGEIYELYKTYDGTASLDLFKKLYTTLYSADYLNALQCSTSVATNSGVDSRIEGTYAGYYITIPIESTSHYLVRGTEPESSYKMQNDVYSYEIGVENEFSYTVLIRDKSNTKKDLTSADDALVQYTNYPSAKQTLSVSHDPSHFVIQFTPSGSSTAVDMISATEEIGQITLSDGRTHSSKISYLSPTNLSKIFSLSFTPTVKDEDITIQVDKLEIKYYAYEEVTKQINGVNYSFYRLSDSASIDTVYDFAKNGENYDTVEYEIRPTANYTREGKYEITRTYYLGSDSDEYSYNNTDFYKRTYVLYVDRNDVISAATRVESADGSTHLESLVGGDIFVAMFDNGKNTDFVVTFPNSEEGNTDNSVLYNNNSTPKSLFTTNMLPVNVYVPQYKYTTFVQKVITATGYEYVVNFDYYYTTSDTTYLYKTSDCTETLTDDAGNAKTLSKDVYLNAKEIIKDENGNETSLRVLVDNIDCYVDYGYYANLKNQNYYNPENSSTLIADYALYAEIYKDGTADSNIIAKTSSNFSNPTINTLTSKNGFLNFYDSNNNLVENLTAKGTYYIKIYQGRYGFGKVDGNDFEQSLTLCFEIESSSPDFEAQKLGTTLNSDASGNYYTNQTTIDLVWDPGDTFMAEIDIEAIELETPTATYSYSKTNEFWSKYWTKAPTLENGLYKATLDLEALGVYTNNGWVKVTMQYKNHNESLDENGNHLYQKVTKTIYVDLSAPNQNIQELVSNAIGSGLISSLTENSLRTYYTAREGEVATGPENTSYNVSNSTNEYFKYYSYSVTADFVEKLKSSADLAYIRIFESGTKYDEDTQERETSHSAFSSSHFTEIRQFNDELLPGNYYEIVESDLAGNLTIYTIYVTTYNDENEVLIKLQNSDSEIRTYTVKDYNKALSYQNATHNIYALTGYELETINYFGDAWAQFKLTTRDTTNGMPTTKTIMLSPWHNGRAYVFDNNGEGTLVYIRDLIKASKNIKNKDVLEIYDRCTRNTTNFYINIQSSQLSPSFTSVQSEEYISFNMPSDAEIQSTSYGTTYLTSLKITAGGTVLYEFENSLGYANLWIESQNENVSVEYDAVFNRITFRLNPSLNFTASTKIVYEFTDNFGTTTPKTRLFNEPIISTPIQSKNELYSYYENGRLIYITKDGFQYIYNPVKEDVKIFEYAPSNEGEEGKALSEKITDDSCQTASYKIDTDYTKNINTLTVNFNPNQIINNENKVVLNYNNTYILKIYEKGTDVEATNPIYFKLYDELVYSNSLYNDGRSYDKSAGDFKLLDANGNDITQKIIAPDDLNNLGYFSEVRLIYNINSDNFIPVRFSVSRDLKIWENVTTGTKFKCETDEMEKYYLKIWYDQTYLENKFGSAAYAFENVPKSQIFEFNLSALTATYWIENSITGQIVEKDDSVFTASNGTQYSNHYIVNIPYADRESIKIKTNEELGIRYFEDSTGFYEFGSNVKSQVYLITNRKDENGNYVALGNIPAFETKIVITYLPNTNNFVKEFHSYNINGVMDENENLINLTSKSIVIPEGSTLDAIQLQWSKYYDDFPLNTIKIRLIKDGTEINPVTYSKTEDGKEYNYIYLTHSGKYQIYLKDDAGNLQKFNHGSAGQSDYLTFIFLKDVPFTVTYTNPETQQEETSTPIKQAVYNGSVTLNIDPTTRSEFYSIYPEISVKRNGIDYKNFDTNNTSYTFSETGFYQISFSATSGLPKVDNVEIRKEIYEFTIIDPNEHRYSYIFNGYSNYYVEKIVKDGKDITTNLVKSLDVETITIKTSNGTQTYLKELPLSYLDEKTGAGTYLITVNSNDKLYQNSDFITSWTYQVKINVGSAPLKISLAEGGETTGSINFTFNAANVYTEMGNSFVRVVYYIDDKPIIYSYNGEAYNFEINAESTEQISKNINTTGTYYIQIVSSGNNLLYSYKVVRTEPMNAATIIIIVISVIATLAIILIVIKLRKRISVK